jgi:hypothetical protein
MTSASSAGIHRHFWQSSQHTHAARGGGGGDGGAGTVTEVLSPLHKILPGKSVGVVPEFVNTSSVAGLRSPMYGNKSVNT